MINVVDTPNPETKKFVFEFEISEGSHEFLRKDKTFIEKILDTSEKKANKIANDNLVKIKNTIGLI